MSSGYRQTAVTNGETHFTNSPTLDVEYSRMVATPRHLTTFNGGDIVPIYCREVLPGETLEMSMDMIIRQTTLLRPVFGELFADVYAFFVPNRVVNESWVNVEGENSASMGIAPDVSLAPLVLTSDGNTKVPVGSVADYYGFPTQSSIPNAVLVRCHDLKFRGYLSIYNEFFRDQNYQPPIPFSKLNIFENFMVSSYGRYGDQSASGGPWGEATGDVGKGALVKAIYGEGAKTSSMTPSLPAVSRNWGALDAPLKANKLHDYFTSVLPYPQKGLSLSIAFPSESLVVPLDTVSTTSSFDSTYGLRFKASSLSSGNFFNLGILGNGTEPNSGAVQSVSGSGTAGGPTQAIVGSNLVLNLDAGELGTLDISNLRTVIATQQIFEVLARSGSRYREFVQSMFGISADDPYKDIPELLGHVRRTLNNYQVAQTSPSQESATPQANLAAYSYTATGGELFKKTFLEHGYVHIMCVVRQKNLYPAVLWKDNFRRSFLDFYMPPLANISEQPVPTEIINPFQSKGGTNVFGYQEAWAEYRYEPDVVSGLFREGVEQALSSWTYSDEFDMSLVAADGSWLYSNAQAVIDPTLAVESSSQPQFFGEFAFKCDKTLPMPVYSVPGLDIF